MSDMPDVYLMGTVMLIFGMGLYELFVRALEVGGDGCEEVQNPVCGSNLFGLFRMRVMRPFHDIHFPLKHTTLYIYR